MTSDRKKRFFPKVVVGGVSVIIDSRKNSVNGEGVVLIEK